MTAQTYDNLHGRALQVMNETAGFANSETRVGSLLRDMVDSTAFPDNVTTTINVPGDYASLNAALESIEGRFIPASSFVDIVIAAGVDTSTTATVFRHPCGERVRINGFPYIQTPISSLQSVSGAAGAYSVAINVSSTSGMAAGDYAVVAARGGTGPWQIHSGAWEVLSIDSATRLTVKNTARNAAFPSTTLTSGSVNVLRTVLRYNGCDGIRVEGSKLGLLKNVMIVGNGAGDFSGLNAAGHDGVSGADIIASKMTGTGSIVCGEFVGVNGFGANGMVSNHGSSIFGNSSACCNNGKYGYYAAVASSLEAREGCGNGNATGGVIADYGGTAWVAGGHFCGNAGNGIFVFNGGHVVANEAACNANTERGIDVRIGDATAELANCNYNGTGGVLCRNGSRLAFDGSTASNNTGPGVECFRNGTIRGETLTASTNSTFGIMARLGGYVYAAGATTASNTTAQRRTHSRGIIEDPDGTLVEGALVRATLSADQVVAAAETLVTFDTEQLDLTSEFATGTSIYTANSARRVRLHAEVHTLFDVSDNHELRVKKNGSVVAISPMNTSAASFAKCVLAIVDVFDLVSTDTLAVYYYQDGGARTIIGGVTESRLIIEEV